MLHDTGVQPFEEGQKLEPHARAQESGVAVRRIMAMRNPVTANVRFDVRPAGAEHGADPVAVDCGQDPEISCTRAAEDPHEHGLRAVVGVVARGDPSRPCPGGGLPERLPAGRPRSGLQVAAGTDGHPGAFEGHLERAREGLGLVQLERSFRAQSVIDPLSEQAERELSAQEPEDVEERHRIHSAAHRDEHGVAPSDEGTVAHDGAYERDEGGRMGSRQGSSQLECLAELDLGRLERVPPGGGRVVERASRGVGVEVRAVVARKAEVVSRHFEVESLVDERLHERRRSRAPVMSVAAPGRQS